MTFPITVTFYHQITKDQLITIWKSFQAFVEGQYLLFSGEFNTSVIFGIIDCSENFEDIELIKHACLTWGSQESHLVKDVIFLVRQF